MFINKKTMSQEGAFATFSKNRTHDGAWDLGFILPHGKEVYVNRCMFENVFHRRSNSQSRNYLGPNYLTVPNRGVMSSICYKQTPQGIPTIVIQSRMTWERSWYVLQSENKS
jgi:hypothetical protein